MSIICLGFEVQCGWFTFNTYRWRGLVDGTIPLGLVTLTRGTLATSTLAPLFVLALDANGDTNPWFRVEL